MSKIPTDPVRLDAAVDQVMLKPIDPVSRAEMVSLKVRWQRDAPQASELDPPGLVGSVLSAVMPHISHPGVLRIDRRIKLLERLEARASSGDTTNPLLAGSVLTLRHELQNLALLRRHRDRLIEG